MRLDDITPLILTYNEIANIERTLDCLDWASRILVVDSYSTDGTLEVLARNRRVEIVQHRFHSFADQCNFGITNIGTEWVLSLDADYICNDSFVREIEQLPGEPGADGFRVSFKYCVNGRPLRGSLYPPRTVLYRKRLAHYENDGHAHRVVIDGAVHPLSSVIYHDDRKPLDSWLAAQARYAAHEVQKLRAMPLAELSRADRLRRKGWIAPLAMPFYCLLLRGLILDGRAGIEYTLQRTYAEILLSLRLWAAEPDNVVAQNEHDRTLLSSAARPTSTVERGENVAS